jgi:hypothetical protein
MSSFPLYGSGRQSASFGAQRGSSTVYSGFGTSALGDGLLAGGAGEGTCALLVSRGAGVLTAGDERAGTSRLRSESQESCKLPQPKTAKSVARHGGTERLRSRREKQYIALWRPVSRNRRRRTMPAIAGRSCGVH